MKIILNTKDIEIILEAYVKGKFGQDMAIVCLDTYTYSPTATFTPKETEAEQCNISPQ